MRTRLYYYVVGMVASIGITACLALEFIRRELLRLEREQEQRGRLLEEARRRMDESEQSASIPCEPGEVCYMCKAPATKLTYSRHPAEASFKAAYLCDICASEAEEMHRAFYRH